MFVHPQWGLMSRGSTARTVNGDITVQAPGLQSSAVPVWGFPPRGLSSLRMEAVNPNESFVSSLYAKPHPKCNYKTVRTHTFPAPLICAEVTSQSSAQLRHSRAYWSFGRSVGPSVGFLEWHKQTNVLTAATYSRNNFWRCSFVATHGGKQNWAPLFHNIMCVYLTDCLHSIQHYQSDLPDLTASFTVFTNTAI